MRNNKISKILGKNIRKYRKEFGMNQEQLAKVIGLSRVSVVNIEAGNQAPANDKIMNICSIFHITPNDLFPAVVKGSAIKKNSLINIKFKDAKSRKECLNDPEWVSTMNKLLTKAHYMKKPTKK